MSGSEKIYKAHTKFRFVELAKYRKQHKNNQQAGSLIMRPPAFLYTCKYHFSRGVQMPSLNTLRGNMVKLYHVQCSNECKVGWVSLFTRMFAIRSQRISGKDSIMRLFQNMRRQRIRATKRRGRVPRNIMAIPIKKKTKRQHPFDNQ